MNLDEIRNEIERRRKDVIRQRREIAQLEKAGISTRSANELLERMQGNIDQLCEERDKLKGEKRVTYAGTSKEIRGPQYRYR